MRLENCHIENFGKLSDISMDFTPGCNVINQENGWGKSTLADFIRVMFYGFANERTRKSDYENERKRYIPWQGGTYGGQITFSTNGKRYVMSRTFGTKEKDDTFELRSADTNMICDDFSTDIGRELFHINRESFQKTVFISHNDCETASTDDIHAKIGNLAEYTDDIKNYQQVEQALTDMLNAMSSRRKTGMLYKKKEQIQALQEEIRQGRGIEDSITQKEQFCNEEKEKMQNLEQQMSSLQKEQKRRSRIKDAQSIWQQYDGRKEETLKRQQQLEAAATVFPEEIPDRKRLEHVMQECSRLAQLEKACNIYRFDSDTEQQWKQLSEHFLNQQNRVVPEEIHRQMSVWEQCVKEQENLERRRIALEAEKKAHKESQLTVEKSKNPILLMGGVVLLAIGIWLFLQQGTIGVVPALAGIVCLIVGICWGRIKGKSMLTNQAEQELEHKEHQLTQEEKALSDQMHQVKNFCTAQGIAFEPYQLSARMMELVHRYRQFEDLKQKKENYLDNEKKYHGLTLQIQDFIREIGFEPEQDLPGQLRKISRLLDSYQSADREYEEAQKRLREFEENNNLSTLPRPEAEGMNMSMEDISTQIEKLSNQIQHARENISSYRHQIEADQEEQENLQEKEEELNQLLEEFEKEKTKLSYIEKTKHYLEAAKESFTSRHMEPVMGAFRKYYRLLTGCSGENFHIDANMNITISELGLQREMEFFSAGYRDLMGLCLRMAFVQAMYQEEKPFILLDDPFVNLDEKKGNAGLNFVREIAADYQVIYFTCRNERDVNFVVQSATDCGTL